MATTVMSVSYTHLAEELWMELQTETEEHFAAKSYKDVYKRQLWLSMMSGKAMMVLLPMRVLKNLIKCPVDSALFYLIAKLMESLGLVRMIRKFQAE